MVQDSLHLAVRHVREHGVVVDVRQHGAGDHCAARSHDQLLDPGLRRRSETGVVAEPQLDLDTGEALTAHHGDVLSPRLQQSGLANTIFRPPAADRAQQTEGLLEGRKATFERHARVGLPQLEEPDELGDGSSVAHHQVERLRDELAAGHSVLLDVEVLIRLAVVLVELGQEGQTFDASDGSHEAVDAARYIEDDDKLWVRLGRRTCDCGVPGAHRLLQRRELRCEALPLASRGGTVRWRKEPRVALWDPSGGRGCEGQQRPWVGHWCDCARHCSSRPRTTSPILAPGSPRT